MECVKAKGRLVLPVFYDVDPCDVRHQKGSYGEAMAKHEERFKDDKEKVQTWKEALRQAANLSGKDFKLGEIIRQESPEHPSNRSRLWIPEDVVQVLEENTGTGEIEIMILDAPKLENIVVEWDGETFKKMRNLEILIIRNTYVSQGAKHLPNSLRVLEWWNYPSNFLPSTFYPKKLAIFKLPCSSLISVGLADKQKIMNLKVLKIDNSDIEYIPDVSNVPNLEELSFQDCRNLIEVHKSVGLLDKLSQLGISGCSKLRSFPALSLPCLTYCLDFSGCSSLENFPEILGDMEDLAFVEFHYTSIKELPCSFTNFRNLLSLEFGNSHGHYEVSCRISMQQDFNVRGCGELQFPKQDEDEGQGSSMVSSNAVNSSYVCCDTLDKFFAMFVSLSRHVVTLDLSSNKFTILPESIKELCMLRKLTLDYCKELREIRGIPPNIEKFSATNCMSLTILPESFKELRSLRKLTLYHWRELREIRGIPPNIEKFSAINCMSLIILPESFKELCSLRTLTLDGCREFREIRGIPPNIEEFFAKNCMSLTILPERFKEFCSLRTLTLDGCRELREIRGIPPNIEEFSARNCMSLTILPESFKELCLLRKLTLYHWRELREIRGIPPNIEEFTVVNCMSLTILPESIKKLCSLRKLTLDGCKELREIRGIPPSIEEFSAANGMSLTPLCRSMLLNEFMNLKVLKFDNSNMEYIPEVSGVPNLEELSFQDCGNLIKVHKSIGFLDKLSQLRVPGCSKLRSFPALMLPWLVKLDFRGCLSLENFPKIVGDMEGLAFVDLCNTSIKELPYSFTKLRNLQSLKFGNRHGSYGVLGSFSMRHELNVYGNGEPEFPKQDEDEGQGSSIVSSNATNVSFKFYNTLDEFIAMFYSLFHHVITLDISWNDFTILPESIKEFCSLRKLTLDGCGELREIRGIPPNIEEFSAAHCMSLTILPKSIKELCSLRKLTLDGCKKLREIRGSPPNIEEFSATNCMSLTLSCRSMLLNEEYYSRNVYKRICFPGSSIPKWFEHSTRSTISFWFRNKAPSISLCVVWSTAATAANKCSEAEVYINGNKINSSRLHNFITCPFIEDHITIFNLRRIFSNHELLSENEWSCVVCRLSWNIRKCPLKEHIAIHVHKHESNMEDIRFTNPLLQVKEVNMGDFRRDTEQEKNLTTLASVETQQGKCFSLNLPQAMNSLNDNVNGDLNSDLSKDKGKDLMVYDQSSEENSIHSYGQELLDKNWESNSMKLASTSDTIREGNDHDSWMSDKELLSLRPCREEPLDCEKLESNLMQLASTSDSIKNQADECLLASEREEPKRDASTNFISIVSRFICKCFGF